MEPFDDQPLGERPHIAVFSSDKVGNFVVITPLLRGLRHKYPGCVIDFFGGEITRDFEEACPYIAARCSLYGGEPGAFLERLTTFLAARRQEAGDYILAINCDEFSELNVVVVTAVAPRYIAGGALTTDFRRRLPRRDDPVDRLLADTDWNGPGFVARHAPLVHSNYIGEIFCRLARLTDDDTDPLQTEVPTAPAPFVTPDILLHLTTTRGAKLWHVAGWAQVIAWCAAQGLTVGLLGHRPEIERRLYNAGGDEDWLVDHTAVIDLRGETRLTELAGAFAAAKAAVCVDAGPMHIAAAVGCPTVVVFGVDHEGDGASPVRLWAPRGPHVQLALSPTKCRVCIEQRFRNSDCLVNGHPCMRDLSAETVIAQLTKVLKENPVTAA